MCRGAAAAESTVSPGALFNAFEDHPCCGRPSLKNNSGMSAVHIAERGLKNPESVVTADWGSIRNMLLAAEGTEGAPLEEKAAAASHAAMFELVLQHH